MRTIIPAGVLLLAALTADARQIQEVGTASTFDVATWNIEWFGSESNGPSNEDVQLQNAADIVEQAGIDLWAVQEISSPTAFQVLLDRLGPPWTGELSPVPNFTNAQRIGYIWRTDVVTKGSSRVILDQFSSAFAGRPPLRLEATVTLPDTSFVVVLVTTHMKAQTSDGSYDQRVEASMRLKTHLDFFEPSANLVWLGDLNDELLTSIVSGQPSPYQNFRTDSEDYLFLTLPLDAAGECTFCGGSTPSTLDHILVSDELFGAARAGVTDRLDAVYQGFPGYLSNTSDHYPVYARLDPVSGSVGIEPLPEAMPLELYPVPADDHVTLRLPWARRGGIEVRIVDLLGRERGRYAVGPGGGPLSLDISDLPPSLYLVVTPRGVMPLPVVR